MKGWCGWLRFPYELEREAPWLGQQKKLRVEDMLFPLLKLGPPQGLLMMLWGLPLGR